MDSAHVSLVSLQLNENGFEEFRCDKPMTLGINLVDFSKILKMANNNDIVTLKADEENSFLNILFENKGNLLFNQGSDRSAEFQLNLLTLDTESLGIPDTEYPTYIRMSSSEFVRLCKDMTQLADAVHINVAKEGAVFSVHGKAGAGKIKLRRNNAEKQEDQIDIKCEENISAGYGLQYLNSFAKASSLSGSVCLYLSSQFPLMIEYAIENMGYLKFYLAPKMDEDTN
jgi:proliferating cell nuclear antigen